MGRFEVNRLLNQVLIHKERRSHRDEIVFASGSSSLIVVIVNALNRTPTTSSVPWLRPWPGSKYSYDCCYHYY